MTRDVLAPAFVVVAVVLDNFGEEHVCGERGGLTYRITGELLPEGLNGFGQGLDAQGGAQPGRIGTVRRGGDPVAFSHARGEVWGGEASSTWTRGAWSTFGNLSYVATSGIAINSTECEFPADELAYIPTHRLGLDHGGQHAASGGVARAARGSRADLDIQYGYGLRSGSPTSRAASLTDGEPWG